MNRPQVVTRVAQWSGWCTPCQSEDRPLVLTRSGPAGVRSWLAGLGDDDRLLLLTCRVCGDWQVVPPHESDDPEVLLVDDEAVEVVLPDVTAPVVEPVIEPAEEPVRVLVVGARTAGVSAEHAQAGPAAVPQQREPDRPLLRVVRGGVRPTSFVLPSDLLPSRVAVG